MKRALIFSPYLDTLGGGEVYALNFAKCLENSYAIHLAWTNPDVLAQAKRYLGIEITHSNFDHKAYRLLSKPGNLLTKYLHLRNYHLIFFVSDGSIPWLFSQRNYIHFQVPFTNLDTSISTKLKLKSISRIIVNSKFTNSVISPQLSAPTTVIYPPLNTLAPRPSAKKNIILSVGRFTNTLTNKRQDLLIKAFKKLYDQGIHDWTLHLVGSTRQKEAADLVTQLKKDAQGYPIKFFVDIPSQELKQHYSTAKIFWHAAGFDVNQSQYPEQVEHFGIVTVEAMAAGCVPIVIDKGGQPEIVTSGADGFLFSTLDQLIGHTYKLCKTPKLLDRLSAAAAQSATRFSKQNFCKHVTQITTSL